MVLLAVQMLGTSGRQRRCLPVSAQLPLLQAPLASHRRKPPPIVHTPQPGRASAVIRANRKEYGLPPLRAGPVKTKRPRQGKAGPARSQKLQPGGKGAYTEQLQWLESLQNKTSWDAVERSCPEEPLARIGQLLQHAATAQRVPRAKLLYILGKAAAKHSELLAELKLGPLHQPLQRVFAAAVREGDGLLGHATAMSQTAMAQVDLGMSYSPFWEALQVRHVDMWSRMKRSRGVSAGSVLYAHAKLLDMGVLHKPADARLQSLFIRALAKHANGMQERSGAQAISLSCWALGKERIPFGQARGPILDAVVLTVPDMTSQHVSNTLWGFAESQEPLGEIVVPLLTQLLHMLERRHGGADGKAAQDVSVSVEAYADLHCQGKATTVNQRMRDALIAAVWSVCSEFTDQGLAMCVLGLGKLGWKHGAAQGALLAALGEKTLHRESTLNAQNVTMLINGFQQSEQELPGGIMVALLERLLHLPPEEVEPKNISQSVVSYGILHSTGKAAAVTARLQQRIVDCVAIAAPSFSSEELSLCLIGLGKLHWGFGAALGPLQEAVATAAGAEYNTSRLALKDINTIRNAFSSAGEPLGVAADALQRRQARLQKGSHDIAVKV